MRQMLHWPHWRVFLYTMAVPLAFFFIGLFEFVSESEGIAGYSFVDEGIYTTLVVTFFNLILAAWEWTVGHALFRRLPEGMTMNLSLFQAAVLIPVVYDLVHLGMMGFGVSQFEAYTVFASLNCVVAMFTLYIYYFLAKSLSAVEKNTPTTFSDYFGEFFLLLFLFIGIWLIQPRINRIFSEREGIEKHLIG